MEYNKNADMLLLLLFFTTSQCEKNWKNIIFECRRSEKVKNSGVWEYSTAISTES